MIPERTTLVAKKADKKFRPHQLSLLQFSGWILCKNKVIFTASQDICKYELLSVFYVWRKRQCKAISRVLQWANSRAGWGLSSKPNLGLQPVFWGRRVSAALWSDSLNKYRSPVLKLWVTQMSSFSVFSRNPFLCLCLLPISKITMSLHFLSLYVPKAHTPSPLPEEDEDVWIFCKAWWETL